MIKFNQLLISEDSKTIISEAFSQIAERIRLEEAKKVAKKKIPARKQTPKPRVDPQKETNILFSIRNRLEKADIEPNTKASLEWLKDNIRKLNFDDRQRVALELQRDGDSVSVPEVGTMVLFNYDALHDKTLPYWDSFPVVFIIEHTDNGFYGINLHYLNPNTRTELFDALMTLRNNTKQDGTTKLNLSTQALKNFENNQAIYPACKRYRYDRVKTDFIVIHPENWEIVGLLPLEAFKKKATRTVWKDSTIAANTNATPVKPKPKSKMALKTEMRLNQFEKQLTHVLQESSAVFVYSTFNPITPIEESVLKYATTVAEDRTDLHVVSSINTDPIKNPLLFEDKRNQVNDILGKVKLNSDKSVNTIYSGLKMLEDKKYVHVHVLVEESAKQATEHMLQNMFKFKSYKIETFFPETDRQEIFESVLKGKSQSSLLREGYKAPIRVSIKNYKPTVVNNFNVGDIVENIETGDICKVLGKNETTVLAESLLFSTLVIAPVVCLINSNLKESLISEGLTDTLYHYTSIDNAKDILSQDKFTLSASIGTKAERSTLGSAVASKYFYYFSMSRSKHGRFTKIMSPSGVFFELDGRKLSTKYKGEAVDYWGHEFRKIDPQSSEMEDRIFSNEPDIKHASKYIISINVLVPKQPSEPVDYSGAEFSTWRNTVKKAEELISLAKTHNIPIHLYDDEAAFKLGNTKKSVNDKYFEYRLKQSKISAFTNLLQNINNVNHHILTDAESSMLRSIRYGEASSILSVEIHGEKKAGSQHRGDVDKLISVMKKMKIIELSDAIKIVEEKWSKK